MRYVFLMIFYSQYSIFLYKVSSKSILYQSNQILSDTRVRYSLSWQMTYFTCSLVLSFFFKFNMPHKIMPINCLFHFMVIYSTLLLDDNNYFVVPFILQVAAYDTRDNKMAFFDPSRSKDFLFISGTKVLYSLSFNNMFIIESVMSACQTCFKHDTSRTRLRYMYNIS